MAGCVASISWEYAHVLSIVIYSLVWASWCNSRCEERAEMSTSDVCHGQLQGLGGDVRRRGAESRQESCGDLPGGCGRSWMSCFRMWLGQRNPDILWYSDYSEGVDLDVHEGGNKKDETLHHDMRALWFCVILICILYRLTLFHGTWNWSKHSQHLPYLLVTQPLFAHEASLGALSGWQLWSSFFLLEGETWTWFREELLSERRRFHCYGLEELQLRMVSYGVSPCVTNDNLWKTSTWFSPEISQHLF